MSTKINVGVPKEIEVGEMRVALTPRAANRVGKLGILVKVASNAGKGIFASDEDYRKQGAVIVADEAELFSAADIILKVNPPHLEEVQLMKEGAILISFLYTSPEEKIVAALKDKKITVFAMEKVPRISRAQNIDALSSQATIAGYKAVLLAADRAKFFLPMLTTAAGSIRPAKLLVIGVGVAGLQAIATAKRLGADVYAYDVRPETKEQVLSLGAKFVDTAVAAAGAGGYARELSDEEKARQKEILKTHVAAADVVITTAGVPGKKAPLIITKDMIEAMKAGAVIIDIMAPQGGNTELTEMGKNIYHNNVEIIGPQNIYSDLSLAASEMYANNITNFVSLIIKDGAIKIDWDDEILKASGYNN